jgi:hypothetical protein
MNDDELNEMLARNDDEVNIFRDLDIARERTALENWRAAGNRGKPPQQLMQLEELPECYQTDEPFEVDAIIEGAEGRGQRKRNTVVYNDGLSDDQWALVSLKAVMYFQQVLSSSPRPLRTEKTWMNLQFVPVTRRTDEQPTSCSRTLEPLDAVRLYLTPIRGVAKARRASRR